MSELTDDDRELLDVLAALPRLSRDVTAPALQRFGNETRVWQHVNALLDNEEAMAYQPTLVGHLRDVRDRRRHLRVA